MTLDAALLDEAAATIEKGGLVVYPTETVYGLGADALNPAAVQRVFKTKRRPRDNPISMAVPDLETAAHFVSISDRERRFAERFLPGPVTLVCERHTQVPDVLTAGRDRVGIRVPDHQDALALLKRVSPITATSANRSGAGSITQVCELSDELTATVDVVLDGGPTPGGGSTVVDVARNTIHREGAEAAAITDWLRTE